MVCGYLRQHGIRVHFLGADVAPVFLVETVLRRQPDVVLLSITLERHLPALRVVVKTLHQASLPFHPPRIVVGGQVDALGEEVADLNVGVSTQESFERIVERVVSSSSWA
jgi:methylmalonyl-CoA mutase cobalamin-binding subunit